MSLLLVHSFNPLREPFGPSALTDSVPTMPSADFSHEVRGDLNKRRVLGVSLMRLLGLLDFNLHALAMYLSDDSHQAMDLPDHTLIGVYRLSILAHV